MYVCVHVFVWVSILKSLGHALGSGIARARDDSILDLLDRYGMFSTVAEPPHTPASQGEARGPALPASSPPSREGVGGCEPVSRSALDFHFPMSIFLEMYVQIFKSSTTGSISF